MTMMSPTWKAEQMMKEKETQVEKVQIKLISYIVTARPQRAGKKRVKCPCPPNNRSQPPPTVETNEPHDQTRSPGSPALPSGKSKTSLIPAPLPPPGEAPPLPAEADPPLA